MQLCNLKLLTLCQIILWWFYYCSLLSPKQKNIFIILAQSFVIFCFRAISLTPLSFHFRSLHSSHHLIPLTWFSPPISSPAAHSVISPYSILTYLFGFLPNYPDLWLPCLLLMGLIYLLGLFPEFDLSLSTTSISIRTTSDINTIKGVPFIISLKCLEHKQS